jgi:hypothetical protein
MDQLVKNTNLPSVFSRGRCGGLPAGGGVSQDHQLYRWAWGQGEPLFGSTTKC